jgi:hypothetical protein
MISRRHALRAASLLSAAIVAPLSPAFAFRIQEESDSPRVRALIAACETRDAHARLIADLVADLEGTGGRDKAVETVRGMACPLCGCRLADGLPQGEPAPRF